MIVNVEFFDENPIENVITSLHYKVDKTLFFGYESMLEEKKQCTERFLKDICGVQEVRFCVVEQFDLSQVIETISTCVEKEMQEGNQVFFDLTGGSSLPLVAFGILSQEFSAPMHKFDIWNEEIHEFGYEDSPLFTEVAECDPISLNLDGFVSLYGGVVNHRMHKSFKDSLSEEEASDVMTLWKISREYKNKWVHYCALLRRFMPDEQLRVAVDAKSFLVEVRKNGHIGELTQFHDFLDRCEGAGFLKNVKHKDGVYRYTYKDADIKNYFWDGGSILEMYAYLKEISENELSDCKVGVHIDWDGIINSAAGRDVLNEIDIMAVKNNLPVFISCKMGNVDQMALYELDTIASRFGGKYATKVLVIAKDLAVGHQLRAEEMGIEVRKLDENTIIA